MDRLPALVIGLWTWKRPWFGRFIPGFEPIYLDENATLPQIRELSAKHEAASFHIWSFSEPHGTLAYAEEQGIRTVRVEDGFLRSSALTGERSAALSLCFDRRGMYFNAQIPSDLEVLLNTFDFDSAPGLLAEAKRCRERMLRLQLSKYNFTGHLDVTSVYGPPAGERILVVGQVEDDMSVAYGYGNSFSNNDLVRLAREENPTAQIIYKPHPDVLAGYRRRLSDPGEVSHMATVVTEPLHICSALQTVDRVYTLTSLVGMESLMRGIPVTVVGSPFYAGWELTDDRAAHPRRKRRLTVDQLFAAAYLLYPRYAHPREDRLISAAEAIELLAHKEV